MFRLVIATCAISVIATHLSPATAAPAAQVITCVDLASGKERISKTGTCRATSEALARWRLLPVDSAFASGSTTKTLTECSNRESSPFTYQLLRPKCAKHMQANLYTRSAALPAKPVIVQAVSFGHDSASLKLATDLATNADAPIAFYTITINRVDSSTAAKVETKRIYSWRDLELAVTGLQGRTTYTFTVTATTVDGTSAVSLASLPVTTPAYVPSESSASSSNSSTVAAPAFTLSSTAETKTVNNAITGYTIASTGGAIATYSISPTAPTGTTFSASTGLLTGTPTSPQSATAYTITATNAGGSTSAIFTLTVASAPPAAPAFTLSSTAETKTVNNSITGYTISSTGGTIASYAISPAAPAGTTFSTSTGILSGTPTATQTATAYTITATNATGSATRTFTLTVNAVVYTVGQTGPGGGTIFYVALNPFACGPTRSATCTYLEAAPSGWNSGVEPNASWAQSTPVNYRNTSVGSSGSPETATATAIGWGYRNTRAIILQGNTDTATSAAALADSYSATVSGVAYDDWYLPSKDELNQMCKWQRGLAWTSDATVCINGTINTGVGAAGFATFDYWSSSEDTAERVRIQVFGNGTQKTGVKSYEAKVRPIRAF